MQPVCNKPRHLDVRLGIIGRMPGWWPFGRDRDSESPRAQTGRVLASRRSQLQAYEDEYERLTADPDTDPRAFASMCRDAYVVAKTFAGAGAEDEDAELVELWERRSRAAASLAREAEG